MKKNVLIRSFIMTLSLCAAERDVDTNWPRLWMRLKSVFASPPRVREINMEELLKEYCIIDLDDLWAKGYRAHLFRRMPERHDFNEITGIALAYMSSADKNDAEICWMPEGEEGAMVELTPGRAKPVVDVLYSIMRRGVVRSGQSLINETFVSPEFCKILEFFQKNAVKNHWEGAQSIAWDTLHLERAVCVLPEWDPLLRPGEISITAVGSGWSVYGWLPQGLHPPDKT